MGRIEVVSGREPVPERNKPLLIRRQELRQAGNRRRQPPLLPLPSPELRQMSGQGMWGRKRLMATADPVPQLTKNIRTHHRDMGDPPFEIGGYASAGQHVREGKITQTQA